LALYRTAENRDNEAYTLSNLGNVPAGLGEPRRALRPGTFDLDVADAPYGCSTAVGPPGKAPREVLWIYSPRQRRCRRPVHAGLAAHT
jgi:hypothetical protein